MSVASLNYKQKRSDKDALVSLASGWFEEHTNGKYWGWMGIIESFNMPPSHDALVTRQNNFIFFAPDVFIVSIGTSKSVILHKLFEMKHMQ